MVQVNVQSAGVFDVGTPKAKRKPYHLVVLLTMVPQIKFFEKGN